MSVNIGNLISKRRKELNMTQAQLADKLYVSRKVVSRWELNERVPNTLIVNDLCKVLHISIEEFYNGFNFNVEYRNKLLHIKTLKYTEDYVSISTINGKTSIVLNKLVLLSERRAWKIKNSDYQNKISVIKELESQYNISEYDGNSLIIEQFISEFDTDKNFERRIKLLCDFLDKYPDYVSALEIDSRVPRDYTLYYKIIGSLRIKSLGYKESNIRDYIDQLIKKDEISGIILHTFFVSNKYTKKYIKEKLQEIYNQFNIKKSAKASDLEEYFILNRVKISNKETGKRDEGFEIIQLK